MEEKVGELWHRLITRIADTHYPEAAVSLKQVSTTVGVMFRALGGDGGLEVEATNATEYGARRGILQRIAGSNRQIELAWRDDQALRLPEKIDIFPERELNRDLYIWLAALAVGDHQEQEPWFSKNQRLASQTLEQYPGIRKRYQRLAEAHLQQRPSLDNLPADEQAQEQAIRQALGNPGSIDKLPAAKRPPVPVPLWLHPFPPIPSSAINSGDSDGGKNSGPTKELAEQQRRKAENAQKPKSQDKGLITIRMENIFSWSQFLNLDRGSEENEDLESAADAVKDQDTLSVTRDNQASAGTLRFDLDLPAEANDDLVLSEGILLPEWDYKKQQLQENHCRLVPMLAKDATPSDLPEHLRKTAKKLRAQFQYLAPARMWHRGQSDGCEIDIDAFLRYKTDRAVGGMASADGLFRDLRAGSRDLACLMLADLSLSTDTWVNDHLRVIDVVRDSLLLFAESLAASGDRFAMYGFSSRKRDPVRFHHLKTFDEHYSRLIRGRINAIKPGYYTRMGAAIRHSSNLLKKEHAERRLLLIVTDGKPNDLDKYEGRYGIEDTRQAIHEARSLGLQPFCVTIDTKGNDYLPHLFGTGGYVVIHKPSQLPKELPLLYTRLTT
jgi:nitric oxide reductase NorD protein